MTLYQRTRTLQDGSTSTSLWYVRIRWQGKQIVRCTGYTARADAERFARTLKKSLAQGREAALSESRLRSAPDQTTIREVLEAFEEMPGDWTPQTRRGYVGGLRNVVEGALGTAPDWKSRPVAVLTGDLVYRFRQAVMAQAALVDDARRSQLARSANTALRSARALFAPALMEHYRLHCDLLLPDLSPFRSAPGFRSVTKEDYRIPDDVLLRNTFADLERTRDSHRDRYVAVWLAIGFGLRKSEAAAVRAGWFIRLGGRVHLELRAVVQPGTPGQSSTATKNGSVAPRIPVSNGAWDNLAPFIEGLKPEDCVLAPKGTATYRADALFDEISSWLRGLGWQTEKAYHEFRALAGCWVAMRDGLLVARDWLRHSSVTTTERNYGRYVRTVVSDVAPDTVLDTTFARRHPVSADVDGPVFGVISGGKDSAQVVQISGVATGSP